MNESRRKIRFGLWYDFRNPAQWHQSRDRLYQEILDQIAWGEDEHDPEFQQHRPRHAFLLVKAAAAVGAAASRAVRCKGDPGPSLKRWRSAWGQANAGKARQVMQ
jgi:hypothetical protein